MTSCGLPGIKAILYGVHMCHFYDGREDLGGTLVPYAEPLPAAQAKLAAQNAGLDVEAESRKGSLNQAAFRAFGWGLNSTFTHPDSRRSNAL